MVQRLRSKDRYAGSLSIGEDKQLVLDDRAAQRGPEDVLVVGGPARRIEVVSGGHPVVAEILPQSAMDGVTAGFDGCIDRGTGRAPKFGAVVAGLHFEFFERLRWRTHGVGCTVQEVLHVGVVVYPVEDEVVLRDAAAVRGKRTRAGCLRIALVWRVHAGSKLGEEQVIAVFKRRIVDLLRAEDLTGRGVLRLQVPDRPDLHNLGDLTRLQLDIHTDRTAYVHTDIASFSCCKSGRADFEFIVSNFERGKCVFPGAARSAGKD